MGTKRRYTLGFSGAGFEHAKPPFEVKYAQSFPRQTYNFHRSVKQYYGLVYG